MAKNNQKQRTTLKEHDHLEEVRDQYEDLPYPPCNPEDDKKRMQYTYGDSLQVISHRAYNGELKFDKLRILTAGGGTGNATIYYAEQLRNYPEAEIVYVDLSEHSMSIAKRRAEIRGLTNIKFVHGSLLECENLDIGEFDIINCVGVLHHLENPDAGLKALKKVLKPDGVMNIMLYGYYGRLEVYMIQHTLKILNKNAKTNQDRVEMAKKLLPSLPASSLMIKNQNKWLYELKNGDAAVFDLLCHPQDKAYRISDIKDFLEQANMYLVLFYGSVTERSKYDALYQYSKNPAMLSTISLLNEWEKYELAELASMPSKHSFLCVNKKTKKQDVSLHKDSVVCYSILNITAKTVALAVSALKSDIDPFVLNIEGKGSKISLDKLNRTSLEIKFLLEVDERKSVEEIYHDMKKKYEDVAHMSLDRFINIANNIYKPLEAVDILCAIKLGSGIVRRWDQRKLNLVNELD